MKAQGLALGLGRKTVASPKELKKGRHGSQSTGLICAPSNNIRHNINYRTERTAQGKT
jgi:hypothetical protein